MTSGLSTLNEGQIAERGARLARRDDREYRQYLREEQRSQAGCPAREVVLDQRGQATTLRIGTSYWLDRYKGHAPRFPTIHGRHATDVVVIGGGITGCLAADLLAESGIQVILLEAERIGRGSTAASTALLMQEPDKDFRELSERHGDARTERIWARSRRSLNALTRLLRRNRIESSLESVPSVYWTAERAIATDLRRELAHRHRAGVAGAWLSADGLRRTMGIEGAGAIVTRGNAQIDPYRACIGIAAHARTAGARAHEHSAARRVIGSRTGVRVVLEDGEIDAAWAIIATGYATPEFKPLTARFRMTNTYVIATPPLPPAARRRMRLGSVMFWDTDEPYHYARWTPDRRLILGGEDAPRDRASDRARALARHARSLTSHLVSLYPSLDGIEPDYAWEGLFATTPDGLPYIGPHRRYPRHLFALGYGGNGMTFGYLAAEILRRWVRGKETEEDRFFGFGR
jgi:glycine/D-amino acid oxidase-like deaminating enzyme